MRIDAWSEGELAGRLAGPGVVVESGPLRLWLGSEIPAVAAPFRFHYGQAQALPADSLVDGHLYLAKGGVFDRLLRQARLFLDGTPLFTFPVRLSYPFLEWGWNHAALHRLPNHLVFHAAALSRDGVGLLMPGASGSGKSTLAAGLVGRGWSLHSDELGLIDLASGQLTGLGRPITLKDHALKEIPRLFPHMRPGPLFAETRKGKVGHVPVTAQALLGPPPSRILFPRFVPGAKTTLSPVGKEQAFTLLAETAFHYRERGREGFHALADLLVRSTCLHMAFGCLEEGLEAVEKIM